MDRPEIKLQIPLERLNKFLDEHEFVLTELFNVKMDDMEVGVKIKLLRVQNYIHIGDWKDSIEYKITIKGLNKKTQNIMNFIFPQEKDVEIKVYDNPWYRLTNATDYLLQNFLKYWGINVPVICTKISNENFETIKESLIFESKMDSVVRKVVSDIIKLIKVSKEGNFELPTDIGDEITYSFPQLETEFSVDLTLSSNKGEEPFIADAEFSRDDDTIFVMIKLNKDLGNTVLSDLTAELNELIAHELTHIKQHEQGYTFPDEPEEPKKYYSQSHELEAQLRGFRRKAKVTGKNLEEVIKDWFEKNKFKHNLKPKQVDKIIKKILDYKS